VHDLLARLAHVRTARVVDALRRERIGCERRDGFGGIAFDTSVPDAGAFFAIQAPMYFAMSALFSRASSCARCAEADFSIST